MTEGSGGMAARIAAERARNRGGGWTPEPGEGPEMKAARCYVEAADVAEISRLLLLLSRSLGLHR